jgi:hypothetical protein
MSIDSKEPVPPSKINRSGTEPGSILERMDSWNGASDTIKHVSVKRCRNPKLTIGFLQQRAVAIARFKFTEWLAS